MAITDVQVSVRGGGCASGNDVIFSYGGSPDAAATVGGYITGGTNELTAVDWIGLVTDTGYTKYCVQNVSVTDACGGVSEHVVNAEYSVPVVDLPFTNNNTGSEMDCPTQYPVVASWNNTQYADQAALLVALQSYYDLIYGAGNTYVVTNTDQCGVFVYYDPSITPPDSVLITPLPVAELTINFSDGSGAVNCPLEFPLVLASTATAYYDAPTFLAAVQAEIDLAAGAGNAVASWDTDNCTVLVEYDPAVEALIPSEVSVDPLQTITLPIQTAGVDVDCPLVFPLTENWTGNNGFVHENIGTLLASFQTSFLDANNPQVSGVSPATAELAPSGCAIFVKFVTGSTVGTNVEVL